MRPLLGALVIALLLTEAPATAAAQTPIRSPAGERPLELSDFWRRSGPNDRALALAARRGVTLLRAARRRRHDLYSGLPVWTRRIQLRRAKLIFKQLIARRPKSPRYWYWYGYAANRLSEVSTTIKAWNNVWALDPNFWDTPDMAFRLGVLYAKTGKYRESIRVYRKGIPATPDLTTRGIMASNCAESMMAIGKLPAAIQLYQKSLQLRPRGNSAAWWGLAVAQDRQGRTLASLRATRRALQLDPYLRGIKGPDVFFVPPGDKHYYLALARESQGRIKDALRHWRHFLQVQPRGRYINRARDHRRRLQRIVASFRPRVWIRAVWPPDEHKSARRLVTPVQQCYAQRAKRATRVPEGDLNVLITVRFGAIRRVSRTRVGTLNDPSLWQCVHRSLRGRLVRGIRRGKIAITFKLERLP